MTETAGTYVAPPESHVIHHNPDMVESVKIEKNTKGFNYEIKAASVERALQMADQLAGELKAREGGGA